MRTRMVARWRRAALSGGLVLLLTAALRAEQDAPPPVPPQAMEPQAEQPRRQPRPQVLQVPLEDTPKSRRKSAPITEQSARPPPDDTIKPVAGTPEEYTIQKGDTLWDLSQKFLSNPWYWPKIWSLNPSIENPHWIYPGNKLRIVPGEGGSQAPAQVQAEMEPGIDATALNAPDEQEPLPGASPETSVTMPDTADLEVVSKNSREGRAALSTVSVSGKLAFSPPPVLSVRTSGLVTPEEMRGAGTLEASFEEKQMLATFDTAYARFRGEVPARPGDKLLIFRPEGPIVDPISHRTLARQTKTVGVVRVLSLQGTQATVQIERTFEEVERGDFVRPWIAQEKRIAPRANRADVVGKIVQSVNSTLTTYGEAHEVFIDRGSADGVQEGNTFAVVRWGDGLNATLVTKSFTAGKQGARAARADVPEENVGLLLVIDTRELGVLAWEAARKVGARVLLLGDKGYPPQLRRIARPPGLLYVRGNLAPESRRVAVVGSRAADEVGLDLAQAFGDLFARAGVELISGGARGIDTAAHVGALWGQGSSIAVLGCGIDVSYPSENKELFARLANGGGAVVSEFPPGAQPVARNFPRRNRTVAALSHAVVVVRAAPGSGALITASEARELEIPVFAIPGNPGNPLAEGPNGLLRDQQAKLATGPEDVLRALGWPIPETPPSDDAPHRRAPASNGPSAGSDREVLDAKDIE